MEGSAGDQLIRDMGIRFLVVDIPRQELHRVMLPGDSLGCRVGSHDLRELGRIQEP